MRTRAAAANDPPAAPVCWQREAPSACLRVELPSGDIHLFSYQHFITAALTRTNAETETLRLCFSGHDVEVAGRGLRELLLELQDFAVKWVRTAPERYRGLTVKSSGTISAIRISAVE